MHVLVIEGEVRLLEIALRSLRANGFYAEAACNAEQGLACISSSHFDLIVLDLGLPDYPGIEVLRQIRQRQHKMPVLILSASSDIKSKVDAFAAGADDYLVKPFALAELISRTQALLRRGPVPQEITVTLGNLELNRLTRQVQRAGNRIDLSAREYALLEYLFLNVGRPLTRSMLIENVWDQPFGGITNVVEVYIRHLRRKIDDGYETKLIQTIRGLGYCLRLPEKPLTHGKGAAGQPIKAGNPEPRPPDPGTIEQ